MMDFLPTLAHLAGAIVPDDRRIDGVDIFSVMQGQPDAAPRDRFFYFKGLALEAVRKGEWKLSLAKNELYHLGNDIGEKQNVASSHPEVVAELLAMAESTCFLGCEPNSQNCSTAQINPSAS